MIFAVVIVAVVISISLRRRPILRGMLISATGVLALVSRPLVGGSVLRVLAYAAVVLWGVLALLSGRSGSSGSRSPRSSGDTTPLGWTTGPNNPTGGRFNPPGPRLPGDLGGGPKPPGVR